MKVTMEEADADHPSESEIEDGPPPGNHYLLYWSMIFMGAIFLLPYNAFISGVDYFTFIFPMRNVVALLAALNLTVTLLMVLASVVVAKVSDTHSRLRAGFAAFTVSLGTVIAIVASVSGCGNDAAYAGVMLAVVATSFGSGVQQASLYGLTSVLPTAYNEAVMTGESASGSVVSTIRIVTKLIGDEKLRTSTLVYFSATLFVLLLGLAVHVYFKRHPVVLYYYDPVVQHGAASSGKGSPKAGLKPYDKLEQDHSSCEDIEMEEVVTDRQVNPKVVALTKYRRLSEDENVSSATATSAGDQAYGAAETGGGAVVGTSQSEDENRGLIATRTTQATSVTSHHDSRRRVGSLWQIVKDGARTRWRISRRLWKWLAIIFMNSFVTLLIFPALLVKVPWHSWHSWMPVVLIAAFNYFDLIGKIIGPYLAPHLSANVLLIAVLTRSLLLPLLLLCILPCHSPYLDTGHSEVAIVISIVMGLTGGCLATIAMAVGPKQIQRQEQELAGMLMVFSLLCGLTIGAYVAVGIADKLCETDCMPRNTTVTTTIIPALNFTMAPLTSMTGTTLLSQSLTPSVLVASSTDRVSASNMTSLTDLCALTCLDSVIH